MNVMPTALTILIASVGLVMFSVSAGLALRQRGRLRRYATAEGVVVGVQTRDGIRQMYRPTATLYRPTVRFQTAAGQTIDHTPVVFEGIANYQVGERVQVHYDPADPQAAIVGSSYRLWWNFFMFGLVGAFFTIFGLVGFLVVRTLPF